MVDVLKASGKPLQFPTVEILNDKDRIVRAWATVEDTDHDSEIIPIDEFRRVMRVWFKRGAPIQDVHSNRNVGKGLSYKEEVHPGSGKPAMLIEYQIYDDYPYDDVVWEKIKSGEYSGVSMGGKSDHKRTSYKRDDRGNAVRQLAGLELYEFSVVDDPANPWATNTHVNYLAKHKKHQRDLVERLGRDLQKGYAAEDVTQPFGGFEDFNACVVAQQERGHGKDAAERICGWLKHRTEEKFMKGMVNEDSEKRRVYLKPGEDAPEGVQVRQGDRGGRYYEDTGQGSGQEQTTEDDSVSEEEFFRTAEGVAFQEAQRDSVEELAETYYPSQLRGAAEYARSKDLDDLAGKLERAAKESEKDTPGYDTIGTDTIEGAEQMPDGFVPPRDSKFYRLGENEWQVLTDEHDISIQQDDDGSYAVMLFDADEEDDTEAFTGADRFETADEVNEHIRQYQSDGKRLNKTRNGKKNKNTLEDNHMAPTRNVRKASTKKRATKKMVDEDILEEPEDESLEAPEEESEKDDDNEMDERVEVLEKNLKRLTKNVTKLSSGIEKMIQKMDEAEDETEKDEDEGYESEDEDETKKEALPGQTPGEKEKLPEGDAGETDEGPSPEGDKVNFSEKRKDVLKARTPRPGTHVENDDVQKGASRDIGEEILKRSKTEILEPGRMHTMALGAMEDIQKRRGAILDEALGRNSGGAE